MFNSDIPLHPAQYEIYINQLINIESPHYNKGFYIRLKGDLNSAKFIEAVSSSPAVFDAFKLSFDSHETDPICVFDESFTRLEVAQIDFNERPNDAKNWIQSRFNTPFLIDKKEPLFENVLIKISSDEHWSFFRYHHLIIDSYGFTIWVNYISHQSLFSLFIFSCDYDCLVYQATF